MLPRNLLIFHSGALGDFVLSWPLGLALGRLYPQSRVIFVTQRQKGELAERVLRLESTDVESGWHHLFGDAANLPELCRRRLEGARAIFTFVARAGEAWIDAVAALAPQARIVPVDMLPRQDRAAHATQRLPEALAEHSAEQAAVRQILASIATQGVGPVPSSVPSSLGGQIILHPGSGSPEKCWPIESYLRLADAIRTSGRKCKFILGEVELERWPSATIHRIEAAAETSRLHNYVELFEQLRGAAAFVGNDSGPSHLAGIIGVASLVLFGPTDPAVWKPLGPRVNARRGRPLAALSVQEIYSSLIEVAG
jgi:ADP-heptose:LPS heptosyltransferase